MKYRKTTHRKTLNEALSVPQSYDGIVNHMRAFLPCLRCCHQKPSVFIHSSIRYHCYQYLDNNQPMRTHRAIVTVDLMTLSS